MRKLLNTLFLAIFIAVTLVISYGIGLQAYTWMPVQATAEAQHVDDLFSFLVAVGAFIFLGITGIIVYAIVMHRAPPDDFSEGHPSRGNATIELIWTITPTLLVIWVAVQSFQIYQQLNILGLSPIVMHHLPLESPAFAADTGNTKPSVQNSPQPANLAIEVTARQWAWVFRYPDRQVTSTELHLPVNQSVQLVLRSEDVLHGFYVPEFRVKQDIIPNRAITFVFTPTREGKYRLRDSQFSGTYFALMDADVYVEPIAAYKQWIDRAAQQPPTPAFNRAYTEYNQQIQQTFGRGWIPLTPVQPPVVNISTVPGEPT